MSERDRTDDQGLEINSDKVKDPIYWALVAIIIVAFVAWQWGPAHHLDWKFDEGTNVIKARLLLAGHGLYREIWSDQPPLFTILLAGAFAIFGQSVFVGRALVLGFSVLALLAVASIGRLLAGRRAGLAMALLLAPLPHFHQLSNVILIGLPSISVGLAALAAGFAYQTTGNRRWLAASGVLFGLCLLIKPIAAPLYLPLSALLVLAPAQPKAPWAHRIRPWLAFSGIVAVTLLVALVLFSAPAFARQVVGTFMGAREDHGLSLDENLADVAAYLFKDKWGLSYAGLLCMAALGALDLGIQRRWSHLVPLVLWLGGSLAALLFHWPLRRHQLFLTMPALAALGGLCVDQAMSGLGTFRLASAAERSLTVAASVAMVLAAMNVAPMFRILLAQRADSLAKCKEGPTHAVALQFLESHTPADSVIITDDPMLAFKSGRLIPPALAVPSFRRVEAGELPSSLLIDLTKKVRPSAVLFWERRLSRATEYFDWVSANYCAIRGYPHKEWMRLIYVPCDPAEITYPLSASTPDGIAFLGSRVKRLGVEPGDSLEITLYWRAEGQISEDYTTFVQLLDGQGDCWGQVDQQPFDGRYPTSEWLPGGTFVQEISLPVRVEAPPGEKMLAVGFYDAQVHRLRFFDTQGNPLPGRQVILSPRPVVRWQGQFDLPTPLHQREAFLGDQVKLLGYALDDEPVRPGAVVTLSLYWQCLGEMDTSYTVFAHLLDEHGDLVGQRDQVPGGGAFPTTGWLPGEVITDEYHVALPQDTPGGTYTFVIGMYDLQTGIRLAATDAAGTPLPNNSVPIGQVTVHE